MELPVDEVCNEHDYTMRFEVPLEAIKTEIVDEEDCEPMPAQSPPSPPPSRVPVILRDNKPKLRKKRQVLQYPLRQSLLLPKPSPILSSRPIVPQTKFFASSISGSKPDLTNSKGSIPRPIMPKIELPPPPPPDFRNKAPPNCKGVLVVQDMKVCTMYVPKSGGGGTAVSHSFPISSLSNGVGTPCKVVNTSPGTPVVPVPVLLPTSPEKPTDTGEKRPAGKGLPVTKRKFPSKLDDNPFSVQISNVNEAPNNKSSVYGLLESAQKALATCLPMYWFSLVEREGITVMLLSIGIEKAVQRRVFVSHSGNVEISVHCSPLPKYFVRDIVSKAGTQSSLTSATVKKFSDWVLSIVSVLRDLQVCVGLEHPKDKDTYTQADDIVVDENPYQECRFGETLRSRNCLRLVVASKRRCMECSKSFAWARKHKAPAVSKKGKRKQADSGSETDSCKSVTLNPDPDELSSSFSDDSSRNTKIKKLPSGGSSASNLKTNWSVEPKKKKKTRQKSVLKKSKDSKGKPAE